MLQPSVEKGCMGTGAAQADNMAGTASVSANLFDNGASGADELLFRKGRSLRKGRLCVYTPA